MEGYGPEFRRGALARELEPERECAGGVRRGQQGESMERGSEGRVETRDMDRRMKGTG